MVLYLCVLGVQGGEGEKKDGYAKAPKQHIRYGFFIAVHIASERGDMGERYETPAVCFIER